MARLSAARSNGRAKILADHKVEVEIADDLPMLELDPVLFEQALFNLLDNAAKYSPAQTTVIIDAWQEESSVKLQVERRR